MWHVVKNLKSSCLRERIFLPDAYVEKEGLPSNIVLGSYVKQLWNYEMENELEIRRLFHLRSEDVDPSQFDKMNVGAAIRFFHCKLLLPWNVPLTKIRCQKML